MLEALLNELRQEGAITKRLLERVPGEKLTWKPHPKSMSLGQLASHVATIPGGITGLAQGDGFDTANANPEVPQPDSLEAILISFEESLAAADQYLSNLDSDTASQIWRLTSKGREVFSIPRTALIRTLLLNHLYHHRGQLSVYLRLLDVPLPVIYGRSADENPFA